MLDSLDVQRKDTAGTLAGNLHNRQSFQVVICDHQCPGRNGLILTGTSVTARPRTRRFTVIDHLERGHAHGSKVPIAIVYDQSFDLRRESRSLPWKGSPSRPPAQVGTAQRMPSGQSGPSQKCGRGVRPDVCMRIDSLCTMLRTSNSSWVADLRSSHQARVAGRRRLGFPGDRWGLPLHPLRPGESRGTETPSPCAVG